QFIGRQGQFLYQVGAGRPMYGLTLNNSKFSPDFLLGEASWGAFNYTAVFGGLFASSGYYQSAALGIVLFIGLVGALSAEVTR
ncbi:fimbria/pilus outer membrane usher protein, partial [Salmonella enterica subsp. enterica serovar Infantis]